MKDWIKAYQQNLIGWLAYEQNPDKRSVLESVIKDLNELLKNK